jgi:hypothetical protein
MAITSGAWFYQYVYQDPYRTVGVGFDPVGEWWVNFGVIGMILGFALAGIVFRVLDNTIFDPDTPPAHRYVLGFLAVQLMAKGLHASLLIAIVRVLLPLTLAIWVLLGPTLRRRRTSSPEEHGPGGLSPALDNAPSRSF